MKPNELIKEAENARKLSYSPYSHFAVGAALLSSLVQILKTLPIHYACAQKEMLYIMR